MASIRKVNKRYYSRVVWKDEYDSLKEKTISLKTDKKSEALARNYQVEKVEDLIREGENMQFGWMDEGGKPKLISLSIAEAIERFYTIKRLDNLKPRTFEAYEQGLNAFMNAVGRDYPIGNVGTSEINIFKKWSQRRHSPVTTNLCLQKIKSFFRYCNDMGYIKRRVDIDMLKVKKKPPMYLTETNMLKLFSSDMVDLHYRKAFYFYAMTGCRLMEAFDGEVNGRWLIIDEEKSKTGEVREVELDKTTLPILLEMRDRVASLTGKSGKGSFSHTRRWQIKKYSRKFKKVAVEEGFGHHKFHNLRDTYAVRRWAVTGDIKLVSEEIGHTSIKMTEKYTKFKIRRLMDDFPTLQPMIEKRLDKRAFDRGLSRIGSKYLQIG
tara:strand:+ start:640 stop:1776 length:1137 start_codon:yes stop_codon:yes gene_type:complete